jgi:PAS domain-containing protein
MPEGSRPLDLILARNLIDTLAMPAFLVDNEAAVVFYNDAAGRLLGKSFEETGRLTRDQWGHIGPVDEEGKPVAHERLPLTVALREGRPAHGRFRICTDERNIVEIETSALPLVSDETFHGALVVFWPVPSG